MFGDTVNTAARIEANGERNKIHMSKEMAMRLEEAGKGDWVMEREEKILVKGKMKIRILL